MDTKKDVLREVLGPRAIGDSSHNQREHQVLEVVDELLEGARFVAAAAIDKLALADGLHQPWCIRTGAQAKCFIVEGETIRKGT
jgi:hypothetical protein